MPVILSTATTTGTPILPTKMADEDEYMILCEEMDFDDYINSAIMETSSDKEQPRNSGSRKGKSPNKNRDFVGAYNRVVLNYFNGHGFSLQQARLREKV
jgi:hypothetical protein